MINDINRIRIISFLFILVSYCGYSQEEIEYEVEGKYLTDHGYRLTMNSKVLHESKEIYVGLPRNFTKTKSYPLVLVLEGEVLFETFAPLTRLMAEVEEIPECIVVGIPFYNKHLEYAPAIHAIPESGKADKMLEFYRSELFPLLDSIYKCKKDRIIWAHSGLGGIFCTYLLLGPDTQFDGILSSSPNLKWMSQYIDKEQVFKEVAKKDVVFYYLTFRSAEGEAYMGEMYENVLKFKQKLETEAPDNLMWKFKLNVDENHFTNAIKTYIDGLKLYFNSVEVTDK